MSSFAIVGAGALGGLYGAFLHAAGNDVHFLLRSDYAHVQEHGLRVDSIWGDLQLHDLQIYNDSAAMPSVDVVCVCWKTTGNHLIQPVITPLLHQDSMILLLQNGIGAEEEVSQIFPQHNIAGGLAFLCSNKIAPGHIHHLDYGRIMLGAFTDGFDLQTLCETFKAASIPCAISGDLLAARWQKLVWNIPYNGLCALHDVDTSVVMQTPNLRQRCECLMHEVNAAAAACGHPVPDGTIPTMLDYTEKMKPYMPSMQLDRQHGRPMELNYMYDKPIALGTAAGVAMPETESLVAELRALEQ